MSEHATGNAVDILALGLADKRLTACGNFTTVLGPGANTAHATITIWILAFMARAETIAFASKFLLRSDIVSSGRADDCHGNAPAWV